MRPKTKTAPKHEQRTYRHTNEIIEALDDFVCQHEDAPDRKLDVCLASYLAEYFRRLDNHHEKEFEQFYNVGPYRPTLLLRAVMCFEESEEQWVKDFRLASFRAGNNTVSSPSIFITPWNVISGVIRHDFIRIMEEAMPEWEVDYTLLDGVWLAVQIYMERFIEKVYIGAGMYDRIATATKRGIGGEFGKTKLLTYDVAGRATFTFRRESKRTGNKSITFIMESGTNNLALGMGIQHCDCDPITAMAMIEDVTLHYEPDKFLEDSSICI